MKALRQSLALLGAEWLRLASSSAWAIFLLLWSILCALFFHVVVNHAAAERLPPGETPMSSFFRLTPWLLPLLLIVFIPLLAMDALAGRRESGRLEHLLIAGTRPLALVLGPYGALLLLLLLLLLPPIGLHLILSSHGQLDPGRSLAGLAIFYLEAATLAAIAIAVGAWARDRLSAGLAGLAIGLIWWITDIFTRELGLTASGIGLIEPLYTSASGLIPLASLASLGLISLAALGLAICGLSWPRDRLRHSIEAGLCLLALIACLACISPEAGHLDCTLSARHSPDPATRSACRQLADSGELSAILIAESSARHHHEHGLLIDASESLCRHLASSGLHFRQLDPGLQPGAALELCRQHSLDQNRLTQPLLLLSHGQRHIALGPENLLHHDETGRLSGLGCEAALLAACRRLADQPSHRIRLSGSRSRPQALRPDQACSSLRSLLQAAGYQLDSQDPAALHIHLGGDLSSQLASELRQHLTAGRALIVALDGRSSASTPQLHSLLGPYGLRWDQRSLAHGADPALLAQAESPDPLLSRLADQSCFLPFPLPLFPGQPEEARLRCQSHLPVPPNTSYWQSEDPIPTDSDLLLSVKGPPRIILLSSVDALADSHIDLPGNHKLAADLIAWSLDSPLHSELPLRPIEGSRYHLSSGKRRLLTWGIGLALPASSIALGILIAWLRRRPSLFRSRP